MDVKSVAVAAPVAITQEATDQLMQIRREENIPTDYCLRIGVKGGGCSGFSYVLGFDQPQDTDDRYEINGINVVMNKAQTSFSA